MRANRWEKVQLKTLCNRIGDGLHGTPNYSDNSDIFFINGNNLVNGKILVSKNTMKVPDFEWHDNFIELNKNSLLLSINGTIGEMAFYNDEKVMLGKSIAYLNFKTGINIFYYYYFQLQNIQKYFYQIATGSTIKNLGLKSIQDFEVPYPNKESWEPITRILCDLDKKIEINNKINTELEAMAKLIYDYWFVQFDFPDENGKPYKSSGGKMVYNEELKREIPDGWSVKTLADMIESDKTGDWGKDSEQGNYTLQVDCIRGADINGLNGKGKVETPNRYILQKNEHKILAPFDIVIEISGGSPTQSTGRMAFLTPDTLDRFLCPVICSNFCKAISLKNNSYIYNFVYQWKTIYDNGVLFSWEGKTSGIKNLLFDSFVDNYSVCLPPEALARNFCDFIEPMQKKKQKFLKENSELEKLRDWLLPMLMNGQVTVSEAS